MSPNFGSQQELEGSEGSEDEVHDRRWGLQWLQYPRGRKGGQVVTEQKQKSRRKAPNDSNA
jgi:hypothetical protein